MTNIDSKITDKIAALLAKAESTTPEEAEVLTAKAEEMMVKYSIDQAMIDAKRLGANKPEEIITHKMFFGGSYAAGYVMMGHYIALGLGNVRTLVSKNARDPKGVHKNGQMLYLVGFESDVRQAEILITSLQLQAVVAMKKWNEGQDWSYATASEAWRSRRQFIVSFGEGAGARIRNMKQRVVKEAEEQSAGTALVLRDRTALVNAAADRMSGGRSGRGMKGGGYGAASAGREAGRNANTGGNAVGGSRTAIGR